MTNTTTPQALGEHIERLVQEYILAGREAARTAMERAFATGAGVQAKAKKQRRQVAPRASGRRPSGELVTLGERLYAALCKTPGETMMVLGPAVGGSARELHRPMELLKRAGRVRSVGTRQATRYYPMAGEGQPSP
jgi:hypothetical protein